MEPYNYIFNKSTSFLDGDFVQHNQVLLQNVLKNLHEIDPIYMDLLNYTQDIVTKKGKETNSVLHMAYVDGNYRSIEILLKYLT